MLQAIKKFTDPVDEEEVPNLARYIDQSVWIVSVLTSAGTVPSFTLLLLWLGLPTGWVLGNMAALLFMSLGCVLGKGRVMVKWFHGGVFTSLIVLFTGLSMFPQTEDMTVMVFCIPLTCAMVTPRSPTFNMVIGLVFIVAMSLVQYYVLGFGWAGVVWAVLLGFSLVAACCLSVQAIRCLMKDLHMTSHQLVATERLRALGQQTAGIAHHLKTPIASTLLETHGLKDLMEELGRSIGHSGITNHDLQEIRVEMGQHLTSLENGLERIAEFVCGLRERTLACGETEETAFMIQERVQAVLLLLLHRREISSVTISTNKIPEDLMMNGDVSRFDQVLSNLITNAIDACLEDDRGGLVQISAHQEGSKIVVVIEDDGPGVVEEHREKIFEPLFTTRSENKSVGLGLSVCRDIIQGHFEGSLALVPSSQGARFELRVPMQKSHRNMLNSQKFEPFVMVRGGSEATFQGDEGLATNL